VRVPAANGLSRTFDDLGPLNGGHIVADSMHWLSDIQWGDDHSYPLSTGCYGTDSKIFPPTPYL